MPSSEINLQLPSLSFAIPSLLIRELGFVFIIMATNVMLQTGSAVDHICREAVK